MCQGGIGAHADIHIHAHFHSDTSVDRKPLGRMVRSVYGSVGRYSSMYVEHNSERWTAYQLALEEIIRGNSYLIRINKMQTNMEVLSHTN